MRFFLTLREKIFVFKQLQKKNIVPLLKYLFFRLGFSRFLFLHRTYYKMRVWKSPFAFWLWTHQHTTRKDEEFVHAFLQEGDTFVDCGAHLGTLTITGSKKVGFRGKVIALEPTPTTFSFLKRNLEDNGCHNVQLHKLAVGEKIKSALLATSYVSDMNHISDEGNIEVQMTTLDHLLRSEKEIALLKLDVEGQELAALHGGKGVLQKVSAVYFESAPETLARMGYGLVDVIHYLETFGFKVYKQHEDLTLEEISEEYETKQRYEDLVALKNVDVYYARVKLP